MSIHKSNNRSIKYRTKKKKIFIQKYILTECQKKCYITSNNVNTSLFRRYKYLIMRHEQNLDNVPHNLYTNYAHTI